MILSPDLWLLSLLFSSALASCLLAVDPEFFHMRAAAHLRLAAENHLLSSQSDLCWVPSGAGWCGTPSGIGWSPGFFRVSRVDEKPGRWS